jgi:hypothetical protein
MKVAIGCPLGVELVLQTMALAAAADIGHLTYDRTRTPGYRRVNPFEDVVRDARPLDLLPGAGRP